MVSVLSVQWWVYRQGRLVARGGGPSISGQQWLGGSVILCPDIRTHTGLLACRAGGHRAVKRKYKFATIREK